MAIQKMSLVGKQFIITVTLVGTIYISRQLYYYISEKTMSTYRDKSALFGRELKPGEPPSWP